MSDTMKKGDQPLPGKLGSLPSVRISREEAPARSLGESTGIRYAAKTPKDLSRAFDERRRDGSNKAS